MLQAGNIYNFAVFHFAGEIGVVTKLWNNTKAKITTDNLKSNVVTRKKLGKILLNKCYDRIETIGVSVSENPEG